MRNIQNLGRCRIEEFKQYVHQQESILCINSLMNTLYTANVFLYCTEAFEAMLVSELVSIFVISAYH